MILFILFYLFVYILIFFSQGYERMLGKRLGGKLKG